MDGEDGELGGDEEGDRANEEMEDELLEDESGSGGGTVRWAIVVVFEKEFANVGRGVLQSSYAYSSLTL